MGQRKAKIVALSELRSAEYRLTGVPRATHLIEFNHADPNRRLLLKQPAVGVGFFELDQMRLLVVTPVRRDWRSAARKV